MDKEKHIVHRPQFVSQFRCLGADCVDTCCKGWNMQLGEETRALYERDAPELLDAVSGEAGSYIMRRDAKTDYCVKFNAGWCGIQQAYGERYLGDACFFYPRATRRLGDAVVMTAALSCPEVARLSLFDDAAFQPVTGEQERLPESLKEYLPEGLSSAQAIEIHSFFVREALSEHYGAECSVMRIFAVVESLERIRTDSWPDAVPFYFEHVAEGGAVPETKSTDTLYLLQALCGLTAAAKKVNQPRLMETITRMQEAMHVSIPMDTLMIAPLPDAAAAITRIGRQWEETHGKTYARLLSRYLAMQVSLALFPFAGFGGSMVERIAIIGIRLATVKLALACAASFSTQPLAEDEVIRIVQSLSRLLDHLSEPDFSRQVYQETGWLKKERLSALLNFSV